MTLFNRPTRYAPCLEDVLYFVEERENIRKKKEAGEPAPWTEDPILGRYRFCNVRRRDDRVTKWIMNNLLDYHAYSDMWFLSAIARQVNWPPTLQALINAGAIPERAEEFEPDLFVKVLEELKASGVKVYGGAYVIYPGRETGVSKSETVAHKFLLPLAKHAGEIRETVRENSVEQMVKKLSEFYGWSSFTAGQVVCDLTYYPEELGKAADIYTWAAVGPGSSKGLNILLGRPFSTTWKQEDFNRELVTVREEVMNCFNLENFTLHDQQNVFCEISKYWAVLNGTGKPKNTYTPEKAY